MPATRRAKRYWLVKTEPGAFSIDDLAAAGHTSWEGVRNYQARNYLRDEMKLGDPVIVYHSNADPPGVAGLAEVVAEGYPDHFAWDSSHKYFDPASSPEAPRWYMVDLGYVETFPRFVPLDELRRTRALADMPLVNKSRLSVQPVTKAQFNAICRLARRPAP